MVDLHDDPIELVDSRYETWRPRFETERDRLESLFAAVDLGHLVHSVEHVGSTAVPGLPAKDVVDLDVVVDDDAVTAVSEAIVDELGGTRYENTETWHVLARRAGADAQRFNVHVFGASDDGWRESVATRDVLRERAELREAYATLKRDLAAAHDDLGAYSRGKSELMARILQTARDADDLDFEFVVPITD
jgi:GrpB-like predicted nucleotidyltransferase (UPF0157 family)